MEKKVVRKFAPLEKQFLLYGGIFLLIFNLLMFNHLWEQCLVPFGYHSWVEHNIWFGWLYKDFHYKLREISELSISEESKYLIMYTWGLSFSIIIGIFWAIAALIINGRLLFQPKMPYWTFVILPIMVPIFVEMLTRLYATDISGKGLLGWLFLYPSYFNLIFFQVSSLFITYNIITLPAHLFYQVFVDLSNKFRMRNN